MSKMAEAAFGDDLFAETHTRRDDPSTSYRAAERAKIRAGSHKAKILDAMRLYPQPMQFEEIASMAGLRDSQAWKRLPDLEKDGYIRPLDWSDAPPVERKTSTGADARLWVLV